MSWPHAITALRPPLTGAVDTYRALAVGALDVKFEDQHWFLTAIDHLDART